MTSSERKHDTLPKLICLIGADGSGKTTMAKGLVDELRAHGMRYHYVYGRWKPLLLMPIIWVGRLVLMRKSRIGSTYKEVASHKKKIVEGSRLSRLYERLLLMDGCLQVFLKVRLPMALGRGIICDRYIYDTVVSDLAIDYAYSVEDVESLCAKLMRFCPSPNKVFLLDVSEDIALKRKSDIPNIEYLRQRRALYLHIAKRSNMVVLDAAQPASDLLGQVVRIIHQKTLLGDLLQVTGSPFAEERDAISGDGNGARDLYAYAVKNKVGLLFLECLNGSGLLASWGLESAYEAERARQEEQRMTLVRFAKLLNDMEVNYGVFKSIIPFDAVPNDIDVLFFGPEKDYGRIVDGIRANRYVEVPGSADNEQRMFHDTRHGYLRPHPRVKDVYDVDLYRVAAASFLIYLDKAKFARYVTETVISGVSVRTLTPAADIVAMITHSILPEQIFTLFSYYTTLYHLVKMSKEDLLEIVSIAKENRVVYPLKAHLSLVAGIHKSSHGFVPSVVEELGALIGLSFSNVSGVEQHYNDAPMRYQWSDLVKTLLEKTGDCEFRKSIPLQMYHMLNPRLFSHVVRQVVWRRKRETY